MNKIKRLLAATSFCVLSGCGGGGGGGGNATGPTYGGPVPDTLSGSIMFKGSPLPGTTVIAFDTNSNVVMGTTTTDANGNYSFANLSTGCSCTSDLQLWPTKPGYAFYPSLSGSAAATPRSAYQWSSVPQNWVTSVGASVTRAGYNGQFTNPNGSAGLVFTVINFESVTNNSITGAGFNAYDGSNPTTSLAATGQTVSYAAGDDGALHKGVAWPGGRFTDNGNGTITDKLTGLIWLKNAACFSPTIWTSAIADANQLANGQCGLSDGSTAGQWRLPNLGELESMIDVSASNPAMTAGNPFVNVSTGIYWSSTPYYGGDEGTVWAWIIRFSDGGYLNDGINNVMATSKNNVWAVKGTGGGAVTLQQTGAYVTFAPNDDGMVESGAVLPAPRMRDNGNGTVTDTATGLIWLKQGDCINQTWAGALAAINNLASGQCGLTDGSTAGSWRMPNRNEMQSLADRAQNNLGQYVDTTWTSAGNIIGSMGAIFNNMIEFQFYWTSTTDAASTGEAWTVFSCDFGVYDQPKSNTEYSLAVRG